MTKENSDTEPTFDPNLGKNNVNDLEFCIDYNEKPAIQTNIDVDFIKKRNIKFKAKEEAKDLEDEEEASYKICGSEDKTEDGERYGRNIGYKRELHKDKAQARGFKTNDDIF